MKIRFDILSRWTKPGKDGAFNTRIEKYQIPDTIGKPDFSRKQKAAMRFFLG